MKPRVFIGSTSEKIRAAEAIQTDLRWLAECRLWPQVFGQTRGYLDSLMNALPTFDFAVFVFSPDDITEMRSARRPAPRDNVVFEFGLFLSRLGPERTFAVCIGDNEMHLPADLLGVKFGACTYDRDTQVLLSNVSSACFEIREAIRKHGPLSDRAPEVPPERLITRDRFGEMGLLWDDLVKRCEKEILIFGWSCSALKPERTLKAFTDLTTSGRNLQILVYLPEVLGSCTLNLGPVCDLPGTRDIHVDVEAGLKNASLLRQRIKASGGPEAANRVEVLGTNWFMAWSGVAVDRSTPNGLMQVELYHYRNPIGVSNHLDKRVSLLLTPASQFYSGFAGSVSNMWDGAARLPFSE